MRASLRALAALIGAVFCVAVWGGAAQASSLEGHPVTSANIYAQETWPDEFAGLWLDFDYPHTEAEIDEGGIPPGQKVFIAFTSEAEEKVAELRQKFPGTNPYVAVTHTYSMAQLEALQREVTGDLREYKAGNLSIPGPAFDWHSTGIWVVDNVVEVNLSKVTPQYEAWAADRYAPMAGALHIFVGGKVVPLADKRLVRRGAKCGPVCRKAKARKRARVRVRKAALRKKCRRAARIAVRTGSPRAKRIVRSKRCRAVRR